MKQRGFSSLVLFLALLAIGGSFFTGVYVGVGQQADIEKVSTLINKEDDMPAGVDFAPFWKAWNMLEEKHVGNATSTEVLSDQDKVWGAIEGLANSFNDPYTVFFPPADTAIFESDISGNFEGVGMEIGIRDGELTVVAPLKGTPAYKSGILSGDRLLMIDDVSTLNINTDEAVKLIRGKRGTQVTFTVERDGVTEPLVIEVVRDVIDIPTIDTEHLENGIFVIRLYNFSAVSSTLFRNAMREFVESGSDNLILDLRNNPGGYLEASIDMASWFLPAGKVIVREEFGGKKEERVYRSKGYDLLKNKDFDLVILINGGSASASEILAGALSEHGVAKLVGTETFGKGSVQELLKLTPDTALKITVARWLTPNGASISEGGLSPDEEVAVTIEDFESKIDPQMEKAIEVLLKK